MCDTDFDCGKLNNGEPNNLICYTNLTWQEEGDSFCGCSAWYGWSNEAAGCSDVSAGFYMMLISNVCVAALALIFLFVGKYTLLQTLVLHKPAGRRFNASNTTNLFDTIACFTMVCWRSTNIYVLFDPASAVNEVSGNDEKYHPTYFVDRIFATLTILFAVLASLSIGLAWVQLANSSSRMKNHRAGVFHIYKKINISFQILFALMIITLMALNQPDLAMIAAFPFIFFIIITFALGQSKMRALLYSLGATSNESSSASPSEPSTLGSKTKKVALNFAKSFKTGKSSKTTTSDSSNGRARYREMADLIKITAFGVIASLVLILIAGGAYAYFSLYGWKNFSEYGEVSVAAVANELLIWGMVLSLGFVQWYCYSNMRSMIRRKRMATGAGSSRGGSSSNSKEDSSSFVGGTTEVSTFAPPSMAQSAFKHGVASFVEQNTGFAEDDDEEV